MEYRKHLRRFRHIISIPFIWFMLLPIVLLHVCIEVYQAICFRLYDIQPVLREDYIRIDRHRLKYLNLTQKVNCAFCGYANGVLQYSAAIGGETEKYWCGVKHRQTENFHEPYHQRDFVPYGDEVAYRERY